MRYFSTRSILAFGPCLAFPLQAQQVKQKVIREKPNIVLIYADDMGYGDLSCYGAERVQTPNVDALATNGLRFINAHSAAATSTPSRYGLFTGEYPWRRKGTQIAAGDAALIIKPNRNTVPKIMKEAGYTTAAIGKWHLGIGITSGKQDWNKLLTPGPREIGFDYSYIMAATGDRVPCVYLENQRVANLDPKDPLFVSYSQNFPGEPTGKNNPELLTKLKPSLNHGHDQGIVNGISRIGYIKGGRAALWKDESIADSITTHAVQFIEKNKEKPFFLYFGTNDIHVPRFPHERFRGKTEMGHRGDAIVQFDWSVGEIVRALKEAGIFENTMIIITSDNGPVVDDGYMDEAREKLMDHKPWGPFRGGKYSNFEAGTRVPFVVHWPGKVQKGISNALVSQIDLLGTMVSLTGRERSADIPEDSRDQLAAWLGIDPEGRDYVIGAASTLTVLTRDWKYIEPGKGQPYNKLTNTEMGNREADQLYDMRSDRGEYDNMAAKNKLMLRFMKQILEEEKSKGIRQDL
ncbi:MULTISPECIES: sulfatase family protein [unclassified Proteiniphilum]|jgi:arylsulfatase A-like enzyme|uniref:sulfatase family protein n=1 Tax=unclassified Proteiniphilum TaxID=2622718 RepID=UPI00257F95F9|nr:MULTISPECIES: arylsulfatase [unclassified Proteiniphilum]MDD4631190.1 arylsulfatase [Proteiniphilum sp.]